MHAGPGPSAVHVRAHAKVNLTLAVAPAESAASHRPGWHRICSWIHAIDLWDDVVAMPLDRGSHPIVDVRSDDGTPVPWPIETDLAYRALLALQQEWGRELPVRLEVRKRIPAGAGLGGGSSDAAAALVAVDRALGLGTDGSTIIRIGAALGSDVPFFLDRMPDHVLDDLPSEAWLAPPRPAIVEGFGERIERVEPAVGQFVLVLPPFGCPTRAVYAAFDALDRAGRCDRVAEARRAALDVAGRCGARQDAPCPWAERMFNDLQPAACVVRPQLKAMIDRVAGAGGRAHITGSGSGLLIPCMGVDADHQRWLDLAHEMGSLAQPVSLVPPRENRASPH